MLSRKAEDYLETIFVITEEKGYARITHVAKERGVSSPSVCEMVMKLHDKGLLVYEKFGGITLTEKGRELGRAIKERHDTLRRFFKIIGVPEEIAEKDACIVEHNLDPKAITQLKKFVDSMKIK